MILNHKLNQCGVHLQGKQRVWALLWCPGWKLLWCAWQAAAAPVGLILFVPLPAVFAQHTRTFNMHWKSDKWFRHVPAGALEHVNWVLIGATFEARGGFLIFNCLRLLLDMLDQAIRLCCRIYFYASSLIDCVVFLLPWECWLGWTGRLRAFDLLLPTARPAPDLQDGTVLHVADCCSLMSWKSWKQKINVCSNFFPAYHCIHIASYRNESTGVGLQMVCMLSFSHPSCADSTDSIGSHTHTHTHPSLTHTHTSSSATVCTLLLREAIQDVESRIAGSWHSKTLMVVNWTSLNNALI